MNSPRKRPMSLFAALLSTMLMLTGAAVTLMPLGGCGVFDALLPDSDDDDDGFDFDDIGDEIEDEIGDELDD